MDWKNLVKPTKSKVLFIIAFFILSLIVIGVVSVTEAMVCYECWYKESTAYAENPILILLDLIILPFSPLVYVANLIGHTTPASIQFNYGKYYTFHLIIIFQIVYSIIAGIVLDKVYCRMKGKK